MCFLKKRVLLRDPCIDYRHLAAYSVFFYLAAIKQCVIIGTSLRITPKASHYKSED